MYLQTFIRDGHTKRLNDTISRDGWTRDAYRRRARAAGAAFLPPGWAPSSLIVSFKRLVLPSRLTVVTSRLV